jgi:hypothetical protein
MAKLAAKGEPTYSFPSDQYSIDGVITTPKGEHKVIRTGWKIAESTGSSTSDPELLSAYIK